MKHIPLDREDERVKEFVRTLEIEPQGSILELEGQPVLRVLPIDFGAEPADEERLKAAILARRDDSRELNKEWGAVDSEIWKNLPPTEG